MRLILLRHAKSSWDARDQDDFDRPLNKRGRNAAPKIGKWIAEHADPDTILVSSAARTRETWDLLGLSGTPSFRDDLYHADAVTIRRALPGAGCVLVIGHNPGIGIAAEAFAETPPDHPDFYRYPTAACTILDFDNGPDWRKGRVAGFAVPRDLDG
ncbi:SixA phosphatase family protein [Jannaschia aquimarina]|uniref:Histidine phosphatase superfamily (Branch 1) n=1 Tax=Jannaschia aquimarina TaxID=935700 RepID=A0A0D1E9L0_9RHOB|nr:histidine phosphatase family protein [Jannaschia aquimarina]KIT14334.1 Histidine phosphatase superfamily (branch 1) [Jannaschia aquimarina]SNS86363.1 phosphohistidine phosphatase [Jannaschia aquimarina]